MIQFDDHIFQMGGFNHQLENHRFVETDDFTAPNLYSCLLPRCEVKLFFHLMKILLFFFFRFDHGTKPPTKK